MTTKKNGVAGARYTIRLDDVLIGDVWVASGKSNMEFSFFFSSRRRHTRSLCDWSSDVYSSDLQRRHADQKAERDRDDHREQIAKAHARDGIAELDAEALVVWPVVVERPLDVLPQFRTDIERARHRGFALRRRQPHQLGVFRAHGGHGAGTARRD